MKNDDQTLVIARAREAQPLDRGQIELARVQTLDALEAANERLNEASLAAALPGGDDKPMIAAQTECERLRQKLQGLAHGLKQVEAREQEAQEAESVAERRKAAVDILAMIEQRRWATEDLDAALDRVSRALRKIETLGQEIESMSGAWFLKDAKRGEEHRRNFLMSVDAYGLTDTVQRYENSKSAGQRYSRGLPLALPAALKALGKAIPEALDADVRKEATAAARAAVASEEAATDG